MKSGFLIAATSSGCGKTTLSLGLMRALTRRGFDVQPFKCGPDYIDTQFHKKAAGNYSINLDTYMSSPEYVRSIFHKYGNPKDVAIAEGVMGLFDGYSGMKGSSAEIAGLLSLPVILLINAASTAYSVAATIYGFKNFNKDINIAGVIFNRVSSESHFSFLKEACRDAGVECLGYIKKNNDLQTPSRHLGLTLTAEQEMEKFINTAADAVEAGVDIGKLLALTKSDRNEGIVIMPELDKNVSGLPEKRVAIARDEAFNFIYPENIEALRTAGYNPVYFSPLHDSEMPEADMLYLPGGYPELFADELQGNESMRTSVKDFAEKGGKIWGECGGLLYLAESIDGKSMCGVFPLKCTMENSRLKLGYRTVRVGENIFKGHEFHYSSLENPADSEYVGQQWNVRGDEVQTGVYRYKNVFASYTHLYWGDNNILKLWE